MGVSYDLSDEDEEEVDVDYSNSTSQVPGSNPLDGKLDSSSSSSNALPHSTSVSAGSSTGVLDDGGDDGPSRDLASLMGTAFSSHMLQDEGHNTDDDEMDLRSAGSIRRMLERAAMFDESTGRDYGSITIPRQFLRPHENALGKLETQRLTAEEWKERLSEASVVDFRLLADPVESADISRLHQPAASNLEERSVPRSSSRHTGEALEASAGVTNAPLTAGDIEERELMGFETQEARDAIKGEPKRARMQCMLLQQSEALEYELIGSPCDELHSFVCDMQISFDSLLHE